MRAERTPTLFAIALILGALAPCVHAEQAGYGQVETFQPGKKYNCVPAADGKGWDCKEIGKAEARSPDSNASAARQPKPADSRSTPAVPSPVSSPREAAPIGNTSEASPPATALPSYLTSRVAAGIAPATPAPARTRAATVVPPASAPTKPATSAARTPTTPATTVPAAEMPRARTQITKPATQPVPPVPTPPVSHTAESAPPAQVRPSTNSAPIATSSARTSQRDFLVLPGNHYVIELAHAEREGDLAATRDAAQVTQGKVYELHLRQNDADVWLLVWGDFDTIASARIARAELIGAGAVSPGWPRRIAPLQAEVRRVQK